MCNGKGIPFVQTNARRYTIVKRLCSYHTGADEDIEPLVARGMSLIQLHQSELGENYGFF